MPQYSEVEPVSLKEWGAWFEGSLNKRVVDKTDVDDARVSTVFLGLDHSFGGLGPPLLFETMIFGGEYDQCCWRYTTLDQAKAGHIRVVVQLTAGVDPHTSEEV